MPVLVTTWAFSAKKTELLFTTFTRPSKYLKGRVSFAGHTVQIMKNLVVSMLLFSLIYCTSALASTTQPLAPAPTASAAVTAQAGPDHFTFVLGGDNRSTGHGYPMPPVLEEICREIGWVHPAFVLTTVDAIEGYGDTVAEANAEYDVFLRDISLTGVPVFCTPGNHEFSLDKALLPVYTKRIGALYGAFDYGHSHFVSLDTTPLAADGTLKRGTIDDAQMAWLLSELEANKGAKNIFVFMHHYVFGPPDPDTPDIDTGFLSIAMRDRVHAVLASYGVRAVFCGHSHIYWHQVKGGVGYYISGGGGAPLDASPEQGGYLHFLTVEVSGTKLTTQILQPGHLEVSVPGDGSAALPSERMLITNTNDLPITLSHLVFHVAAPPTGQKLALTASIQYKNKIKPGEAQIVSQSPGRLLGTVDVVVTTVAKKARTEEISLGPVLANT